MAHDPMNPARRRFRRRRRLGPGARCVSCGVANPDQLTTVDRTWLEEHHPYAYAHAPNNTCVLCLNCHALFSAAQVDDGVPLSPQSTVLERLQAVIAALGSFLGVLGEVLLEWAERIAAFVRGLDQQYGDWRKQSWATM
jgi:hypothetical protein